MIVSSKLIKNSIKFLINKFTAIPYALKPHIKPNNLSIKFQSPEKSSLHFLEMPGYNPHAVP